MAAALACCALAVPATASAATLAVASGPDPAESITTQVIATGALETDTQRLDVTVKPVGGSGCAANVDADDGSRAMSVFPGVGPYAETRNWTFQSAGSYLLCSWITDTAPPGDPVIALASQTIVVRQPHLSLTIAAPAKILRGRTFQVVTTAQAETERDVRVLLLKDTGRGCPANSGAAYVTAGEVSLVSVSMTGGPTSQTVNERLAATGRYLLCGYFDYGSQVAPEATAAVTVAVLAPCLVPHLRAGTSLAKAKTRIVAAHCTVGRVLHAHSASAARGTVIALSPRPGSGHATHAPVQITLSSGPPRHRRH